MESKPHPDQDLLMRPAGGGTHALQPTQWARAPGKRQQGVPAIAASAWQKNLKCAHTAALEILKTWSNIERDASISVDALQLSAAHACALCGAGGAGARPSGTRIRLQTRAKVESRVTSQ